MQSSGAGFPGKSSHGEGTVCTGQGTGAMIKTGMGSLVDVTAVL